MISHKDELQRLISINTHRAVRLCRLIGCQCRCTPKVENGHFAAEPVHPWPRHKPISTVADKSVSLRICRRHLSGTTYIIQAEGGRRNRLSHLSKLVTIPGLNREPDKSPSSHRMVGDAPGQQKTSDGAPDRLLSRNDPERTCHNGLKRH